MLQLKQKNLQSLNEFNKILENINHLDLNFNTMETSIEMLMREARENYLSTLNNFEVINFTIVMFKNVSYYT